MNASENLAKLGLALPPAPEPIGNYVPFRFAGNMLFLSGVGPRNAAGFSVTGKVGQALTIDEGYNAAKLCGLNLIANMQAALGSIDRVDTILKVFGMVNAAPNFMEHPKVINGCTDLCRGVRRQWKARAVGGRDGQPAGQHFGGNRGDRADQIVCDVNRILMHS